MRDGSILLLLMALFVRGWAFHARLAHHVVVPTPCRLQRGGRLRRRDLCDTPLYLSSKGSINVPDNSKDAEFYPFTEKKDSSTTSARGSSRGGGPLRPIRAFLIAGVLFFNQIVTTFRTFVSNIFVRLFGKREEGKRWNGVGGKAVHPVLAKYGAAFQRLVKKKAFWANLAIFVAVVTGLRRYKAYTKSLTMELAYSTFLNVLATDPSPIKHLRVTPQAFYYRINGKQGFTRKVNLDQSLVDKFMNAGVDFSAPAPPPNVLGILWILVYGGFMWNVTTRMMQGPQDSGAGVRKDQLLASKQLSFADIAGQEKAKLEVSEVCTMLRAPARYAAVGARLPAGVLLVGPPGTGKTLLARVTAAEAGVPFYACSASDFVEVFVGRGPARVRKLFQRAAATAPCIVFIDEIDSIGRSRRSGSMNSEQENTLNAILTCMDGLDTSNNGVVVMAATNRLELLDPALLRAGRFDRIVQCPLPDKDGREGILRVSCKKYSVEPDVDFDKIARLTPATSGADLAALSNEAAIRAARRGAVTVSMTDFAGALDSFQAGRQLQVSSLLDAVTPEWLKKNPQAAMG